VVRRRKNIRKRVERRGGEVSGGEE